VTNGQPTLIPDAIRFDAKVTPSCVTCAVPWGQLNDRKLYWFSVTLSFSVLSLATKSGLKAVFFYLGDQSPRPPGVYRFEAKSEVGKLGGARPPNFASGPGTALGLLPSIALSSDQVSLV